MCRFFILVLLLQNITVSKGQSGPIINAFYNFEIGKGITDNDGLFVNAIIKSTNIKRVELATLKGGKPEFYEKREFTLEITIANNGPNDIYIYDWNFSAICPENNMGLAWQKHAYTKIITAIIPRSVYLTFKPGDKRVLQSMVTDFEWCLPKNKNSLLTYPKYIKADIIRAVIHNSNNLQANPIINTMVLNIIKLRLEGKDKEADEMQKALIELLNATMPNETSSILNNINYQVAIQQSQKNKQPGNELEYPAGFTLQPTKTELEKDNKSQTTSPTNTKGNSNATYGDKWYFIHSDKALQYRMKLARTDGDWGYLKVQVRINKNDPIFCTHPNCEGYLWFMQFKKEDGTSSEHHYFFYNSYDSIYELPFEIPVSLKPYQWGIKPYWNDEKKMVMYEDLNGDEKYAYVIWNCVHTRTRNEKYTNCREFKFDKAIILK